MAVRQWLLRCIPGLSILLLFLLVELSLGIVRSTYLYLVQKQPQAPLLDPVLTQLLFSIYTVTLHILAALFPIRLARAAHAANKAIRTCHAEDVLSLPEEQCCATMVIILPAYKENIITLRETLNVLASHMDAAESYDLFLAMEERDPDAVTIAKQLMLEYTHRFLEIQSTFHPFAIPGESAGKSSNVSWAAQEVMAKYNGDGDVLVTVIDSDSHLQQQYFRSILSHHRRHKLSSSEANLTLYVPPIVFDRNALSVPLLVRTADLMWSGAGLSCFSTSATRTDSARHLAIPTSVYTLSLPLVQLTNGWDAGPSAIGEDMHMMLKCYFACLHLAQTPLRIESIPSPVSQCNIATPITGVRGFLKSHSARYSQALRHMWGCLDSGYAAQQLLSSTSTKSSPHPLKDTSSPSPLPTTPQRTATLFLRLLEAHILPAHLPLLLLATTLYTTLPKPTNEWLWLPNTLALCAYLRAIGFTLMLVYFIFIYESYHHTCVSVRYEAMRRAGLEGEVAFSWRTGFPRAATKGRKGRGGIRWTIRRAWLRVRGWLDYVAFPVAGTLYGAVPLCQAAVSHFWGTELGYVVSGKPEGVRFGDAGGGVGAERLGEEGFEGVRERWV